MSKINSAKDVESVQNKLTFRSKVKKDIISVTKPKLGISDSEVSILSKDSDSYYSYRYSEVAGYLTGNNTCDIADDRVKWELMVSKNRGVVDHVSINNGDSSEFIVFDKDGNIAFRL